jgi:hypothetical protein
VAVTTADSLDEDDLDEAIVEHCQGHSGLGWYSWSRDYPDEGSLFWGDTRPTADQLRDDCQQREVKP